MAADGDVSQRTRRDRTSRRDRIVDAVVEVVAERGFAGTTVRLVTARAGVSTRTFYECFTSLEDCMVAILDETLERTRVLVEEAFAREESWQQGVCGALAGMLALFDSDPELARVCVLETLAAGPTVLAHRERAIGQFRSLVVARLGAEASRALPLAFESTVVSVIGMMHARLVTGEGEPLIVLLGPLMGLILGPYLGEQELEEEIARADELTHAILNRDREPRSEQEAPQPAIPDCPSASRSRECLIFLAEQNERGHSPSNREIAAGIGIAHKSQTSRLLAQLLEQGLVTRRSEGVGRANAWRLTPHGEAIARALRQRDSLKQIPLVE